MPATKLSRTDIVNKANKLAAELLLLDIDNYVIIHTCMDEGMSEKDLNAVRRRGTQKHITPSTTVYRSDTIYPDRIIGARELAQVSIEEIVSKTEISGGDLVLFESGMLTPTSDQLIQIARITGFPMAWFSKAPDPAWPGIEHTSLRFH